MQVKGVGQGSSSQALKRPPTSTKASGNLAKGTTAKQPKMKLKDLDSIPEPRRKQPLLDETDTLGTVAQDNPWGL
jgi:hypothetical protein